MSWKEVWYLLLPVGKNMWEVSSYLINHGSMDHINILQQRHLELMSKAREPKSKKEVFELSLKSASEEICSDQLEILNLISRPMNSGEQNASDKELIFCENIKRFDIELERSLDSTEIQNLLDVRNKSFTVFVQHAKIYQLKAGRVRLKRLKDSMSSDNIWSTFL